MSATSSGNRSDASVRTTRPGTLPRPPIVAPGGERDRSVLLVLTGPQQGAVFSLGPRALVGRDHDADAMIRDESISRAHARIVQAGGRITIEDLGSVNGTFVGDTRVRGIAPLEYGERVRFGEHTIAEVLLLDQLEERAFKALHESTLRDPLTGLYNRRYFDDRLNVEFSFARRHDVSLGLLMADLDGFNGVNDVFGHQAGDLALRVVSALMQRLLRPEDVVARFGGEELVVIARETGIRNAEILAERIRGQVERTALTWLDRPFAVTLSLGVTAIEPGSRFDSAEDMLTTADAAMYEAKRLGRNRTCTRLGAGGPTDVAHT